MEESIKIAEYIADLRYNDLTENVIKTVKKSLLDSIGVMLGAGTLDENCGRFVRLAIAGGGKKESTILGFGAKVPAYMAAFANGSLAHALDFEDTHDRARVHPNAATVPAALAIAESKGNVSGKELITALALGSDIVCRLGLALKKDPIERGWYIPPILGAFGAATAASKLLNLTPQQIVDAFSLTLCQVACSAEHTRSSRSVFRAIRDAFSAKAGVLSALLAHSGVAGFEHPFEGESGLFKIYAGKDYDLNELTRGLGESFECTNISYKPWPSCRGTHPFIEATLKIMKKHDLSLDEINEIRLTVNNTPVNRILCEPLSRKQLPKTSIDAKFSIPFTVAIAAVHRDVTLKHFLNDELQNQDVTKVAQKVTYQVSGGMDGVQGLVQISTGDKVFTARAPEFAYGNPENPITLESLIEKFKNCARYAVNPPSASDLNELIENIVHLEDIKSMQEVTLF